jgi:hypothetical protein
VIRFCELWCVIGITTCHEIIAVLAAHQVVQDEPHPSKFLEGLRGLKRVESERFAVYGTSG